MDATRRAAGRIPAVRAWPVWKLPWWLIAFIIAVVAADAAALGLGASGVRLRAHDLTLFGLLLACDVAGLEVTRRAGEKAGMAKDMHAVWELPVAVLLPPVYAPVTPIIRVALTQWRVRRGPVHRRVFSAAALGLSYLAAGLVFRGLAGAVIGTTPDPVRHGFGWMAAMAGGGVVQRMVNSALVMTAVKGSDPAVRLRDAQFAREPLYNDVTELCLAVLVGFGVASSPVALVFAFPFATLPLRALRHAQLLNDSRTDAKTGLLNARTWEHEATAEVTRAVRARVPLAVAVLDIDWFKTVNDTYGHLFGDEVLREIGRCLPMVLREYDLAGRFGGEEFVLLLPHTRAVDAFRVAERVREHIGSLSVETAGGESVRVTVSVGVAALDAGSRRELSELLAAADAALYRAKRDGRNQVQMISTTRGLSATGGRAPDAGQVFAGGNIPAGARGPAHAAPFPAIPAGGKAAQDAGNAASGGPAHPDTLSAGHTSLAGKAR
jgi:diguanylate cyclase (GGDEF)-like protein